MSSPCRCGPAIYKRSTPETAGIASRNTFGTNSRDATFQTRIPASRCVNGPPLAWLVRELDQSGRLDSMCSEYSWPEPSQRKFHEQLPETHPPLLRFHRSRCCLSVHRCCTDQHRWRLNRRRSARPPGQRRSRLPMDRPPAQGLSPAPRRMRRRTVSPRSRPRKRPASPILHAVSRVVVAAWRPALTRHRAFG